MSDRTHAPLRGFLQRPTGLVLVSLSVAVLSACGHEAPQAQAPTPVIAATAQAADAASSGQFPGDVHARYEMPLSFRVAGKLVARYVNPGDVVKKGDKLAELDAMDASSALAAAQAALDAAETRYAVADKQWMRDQAQRAQNLISPQQWEQTQDARAAALAGRNQAREQVVQAKNQLHYTLLVADHDGTVTDVQADIGQVLSAGQAVVGFAWSGEREVHVDLPESRIGTVAVGQTASVTLPSLPGLSAHARVREVAAAADPQAHTYLVKLLLDQPVSSIALGMTANVTLSSAGASKAAVRIPTTALFHQGDVPAVWVVNPKDATLALRPVTVLRYEERDVLVAAGLAAGEQLVAQGVHVVSAGEKVVPMAPPHSEDAPQ